MPSRTGLLLLKLFLCCCTLDHALAHSSGAPSSRCSSLVPLHPGSSQPLPGPYSIVLSKGTYGPFEAVGVTINAPRPMAGFIIQAVDASDTGRYVGTFQPTSNTKFVCGQSGLTHTSPTLKDSQTFLWRAPTSGLTNVLFRATVVENYRTYYVDIRSQILRKAEPSTTSSTILSSSSSSSLPSSRIASSTPLTDTTSTIALPIEYTLELSTPTDTSVVPSASQMSGDASTSSAVSVFTSPLSSSSVEISMHVISQSRLDSTTSLQEPASSSSSSSSMALESNTDSMSPTSVIITTPSSSVGPGGGSGQGLGGDDSDSNSSEKDLKVTLMISALSVWVVVVVGVAIMKFRRS